MLDSLHIQNYRLFKDLKIDKLGQVNLISGKNNCGKTALLEALRILDSKANINVLTNILYRRNENIIGDSWSGHHLLNNTVEGIVEINDFKKGNYVKFALDVEHEDKEKGVICPFKYGINNNGNGSIVFNNTIFVPFTIESDANSKLWEHISLTPLEDDVVNIFSLIESGIQRIAFNNGKATILSKRMPFPIPLKQLGDGANRLFTIALALVNSKNKMLLIDEFEVGLHHGIQEQLWEIIFKYAKEWNIQVFVTTHSSDTVRTFSYVLDKYEEMGQYMRLQKSRMTGEVEAVVYTKRSLDTAMEENFETR